MGWDVIGAAGGEQGRPCELLTCFVVVVVVVVGVGVEVMSVDACVADVDAGVESAVVDVSVELITSVHDVDD